MASPSVANPWDDALRPKGGNPWDAALKPATRDPWDSSAPKSSANPWDAALGGSAGSTTATPHSAPAAGAAPFARSASENPIISALRAGNRFGKHLVATGKLGIPDQTGEDADDATINQRFDQGDAAIDAFVHRIPHRGGMMNANEYNAKFNPGGAQPDTPGDSTNAKGIVRSMLDPTLVIPAGAIQSGVGKLAGAGARLGAPLVRAAIEHAPEDVKWAVDAAGQAANKVGDLFHWGGSAHREMDPETYRDAGLALNKHGARTPEIARRLAVREAAIFSGLSDEQRLDVSRLMNGEADISSSPAVNQAAKAYRKLLDDQFALDANASGRAHLAQKYGQEYELPPELREFQAPPEQGSLGAEQYREPYLPGGHATPEDLKARPQPYNLLDPFNPNAIRREQFKIGPGDLDETGAPKVAAFDAARARSLKNTARQASAGQLRHELGVIPGEADPTLAKLFEVTPRGVGAQRNTVERAQDIMRLPADATRAGLMAFGLKHGLVNVPVLAGLSEGARPVVETFADAFKTLRMNPEEKWEAQREAREAGVIGPEYDRSNPFLDLLGRVPTAARAGAGAVGGAYKAQDAENQASPQGNLAERFGAGVAGAGLGAVGGAALPRIGAAANSLTWAIDEAAKKAVLASKIRRGMKPAEAAAQTLRETVNYSHRTPIARFLGDWGLAPFATFSVKVPGAVAASVARDPRKAMLLDRLTGGLGSQGTIDLPQQPLNAKGEPKRYSMSTPLSETIKGAVDPVGYVRSKASDPVKALASIISSVLSGDASNALSGKNRKALYPTHGEPLLPHKNPAGDWKSGFIGEALSSYVPLGAGRNALDATGADEYPPNDAISQILGPLLGGYVR
jgi:hypothetical protein